MLMPVLNISIYYLLSFFIRNPKYLFKRGIDNLGNYQEANPSKRGIDFWINYYYIFRLIAVAVLTYIAFQ